MEGRALIPSTMPLKVTHRLVCLRKPGLFGISTATQMGKRGSLVSSPQLQQFCQRLSLQYMYYLCVCACMHEHIHMYVYIQILLKIFVIHIY